MLKIHTIPAFEDNYFWLIQPNARIPYGYIVDPGSAPVVQDYLNQHQLQLKGILLTHHHRDHIEGAVELSEKYGCPIYGPKSLRIPQVTHHLSEGDYLSLGDMRAKILEIPGHTLDHIAYLLLETATLTNEQKSPTHLFSGDTLFGAGCGRIFDGNALLLFTALKRITTLSEDTLIYAGHEYTLANIRFALTIEPDNGELQTRQALETKKRLQGLATLPTQLGLEIRTNPFLRCHVSSVQRSIEQISGEKFLDEIEAFTRLRRIKDRF